MTLVNKVIDVSIYASMVGGKRIGRNTLWLGLGRVGTQALMLALNVLIARRLGETGLGNYAFIVSAVMVGNVVTTFGTDMILIRRIAATRDLSMVPAAVAIQMPLSILTILVFVLWPDNWLMVPPEVDKALRLYSLALIPMALFTPLSALLRGIERMDLLTWVNVSTALGQVALATAFIQPDSHLTTVAAILLVTQFYAALVLAILSFATVPDLRAGWRWSLTTLRTVFVKSMPVALLGIIGVMYQRMTLVLLTLLADSSMTGWYAAAARLADAPKLAHYALLGALFPVMAHSTAQPAPANAAPTLFRTALLSLLALSAGAGLFIILLADPLTTLLFGPSFTPAIPTLRLLALSLIPFTLTTYFSLRFLAGGYEKQLLALQAFAMLLFAGINLFSIPRWGAVGGAVATVCIESLQAVSYAILWRRLTRRS